MRTRNANADKVKGREYVPSDPVALAEMCMRHLDELGRTPALTNEHTVRRLAQEVLRLRDGLCPHPDEPPTSDDTLLARHTAELIRLRQRVERLEGRLVEAEMTAAGRAEG